MPCSPAQESGSCSMVEAARPTLQPRIQLADFQRGARFCLLQRDSSPPGFGLWAGAGFLVFGHSCSFKFFNFTESVSKAS